MQDARMTRFAFSAADGLSEDVPTEVEVLHTGKFNHPAYGDFEIKGADLDELVHEFSHDKEALIDVDHRASKGDSRAAGWVKGLTRKGDTLVAKVQWTKHGEALVKGREYRRISAEYGPRRDLETGKALPGQHLKAITITNRPFLRGLKPITLMDGADEVRLDAMPVCDAHEQHDESCPDCKKLLSDESGRQGPDSQTLEEGAKPSADGSKPKNGLGAMTDTIRSVLKLADDAKDDDIIAAVKALAEAPPPESPDVVALSDFEAVKKLAEDATKSAEQSRKTLADVLRDTFLSEMIREGKLAASELDTYRDLMDAAPELTRKAIEARPKSHLLDTVGHGGDGPAPVGDVLATGRNEHRSGLMDAAKALMDADPKLDIGEALIQAEKAAL